MAATCGEEFYCRRGDRAPEKADFFKLPKEDKQLICQLRSAIGSAREKVTQLRDDVEDKDRDISRETALRKAAEARLEQMVDMYGDPAVTEELRRRLPRAGRTDPKTRLRRELDEISLREASSLTSTGPEGTKARRNLAADLDDQIIDRGRKSRSLSADSLQRGGSSLDRDDVTGRRRNRSHSPPDRSRGHNSYHGGGGEDRGGSPPYPRGGGSPSYPYHHHGPYPPPFYPPMYPYPSPMMYPGTPGMMPQPVAQSTPTHIYIPVATPSTPVATPIIPVATPTQNHTQNVASQPVTSTPSQPQPNVTVSHHISTSTASAVSRDSGVGVTTLGGGGATTMIDRSEGGANSIRVAAVNREQQRQISMLLVELDASKNLNKELQAKLTTSERELDSLRIVAKTQEASMEAGKTNKLAELVEEIYRAQKVRDEAMMGRLRVANEDRDEALLKLRRLQKTHLRFDNEKQDLIGDGLDLSSHEQLGEVGGSLVNKIRSRRQRYQEMSTEEMRAVLQDRDATVAKCRQLEAEVVKLQRLSRTRGSDKQLFATQQAKLLATQQERDLALTRVKKLEDELQTLRVYYSLHKSLSQEANLRDQFNNTLKNIEGTVKERDSTIEVAQSENSTLIVQIKSLMAERNAMEEQVEKAQGAHKEAQANCEKLERLVNVLRRKINGLGTKMDDCC